MRIDLHTHSLISDGTDSPTTLVLKAQRVGLTHIALTDHDTFDGVAEADEAGRRVGLSVLPGLELSTDLDGDDVHLLVYGADPWNEPLIAELAAIRASRRTRIGTMLTKLAEAGAPISLEQVQAQSDNATSIGRPHVADALVAAGYVANRDEAFARYLDVSAPAFVSRYAPPLGQAIELVHQARGIAVIAHPWSHGGQQRLTGDVLARLVNEYGLEGIEVDHPTHDQHQRDLLFELGARLGLVRTGGSDYHGTGKVGHDLGCRTTRETAYRVLLRQIAERGGSASVQPTPHSAREPRH